MTPWGQIPQRHILWWVHFHPTSISAVFVMLSWHYCLYNMAGIIIYNFKVLTTPNDSTLCIFRYNFSIIMFSSASIQHLSKFAWSYFYHPLISKIIRWAFWYWNILCFPLICDCALSGGKITQIGWHMSTSSPYKISPMVYSLGYPTLNPTTGELSKTGGYAFTPLLSSLF